jgi:hypothetical protein
MPIEVRELHIRVVVQDTSEATPGSPGGLAVEGDTSRHPDHDGWIEINSVSIGVQRPGSGAAGDDAPIEELLFAYARADVQHIEGIGSLLLQPDASATGNMFRAAERFNNGGIPDSIDGAVWTGGGRDLLLGGAGADYIDAASDGGRLPAGGDEVHPKDPGSVSMAEYALFL